MCITLLPCCCCLPCLKAWNSLDYCLWVCRGAEGMKMLNFGQEVAFIVCRGWWEQLQGQPRREQIQPAWLEWQRCLSGFGLSAQFSCFSQLTACSLKGHLCRCVNMVLSHPFTVVRCSVNSIRRGGSSHGSTSFMHFIRCIILIL